MRYCTHTFKMEYTVLETLSSRLATNCRSRCTISHPGRRESFSLLRNGRVYTKQVSHDTCLIECFSVSLMDIEYFGKKERERKNLFVKFRRGDAWLCEHIVYELSITMNSKNLRFYRWSRGTLILTAFGIVGYSPAHRH